MPPNHRGGNHNGRNGIRRRPLLSTSIVNILNSNTDNDQQARNQIKKVYIPLLCIVYVIDIGCSFSMVYLQCDNHQHDDDIKSCIWYEIQNSFHSNHNNDDDNNNKNRVGDLVWLALIRCIVTTLLLWLGIKYSTSNGKLQRRKENDDLDKSIVHGHSINNHVSLADEEDYQNNREIDNQREVNNNNNIQLGIGNDTCNVDDNDIMGTLTTPLLFNESSNSSTKIMTSTKDTQTNNLFPSSNNNDYHNHHNDMEEYQKEDKVEEDVTNSRNKRYNDNKKKNRDDTEDQEYRQNLHSKTIKNITLAVLFISSTFFQLYAGIKVSTYHKETENNNDHSNPTTDTSPAILVLMCSSILWINIISYIFRVLLEELTREDALFLPGNVHRHPVFYEESKSINAHWCDICRARIITTSNSSSTSSTNSNEAKGGCYRCSLCDFDICLKCAKREDAAIVGENLLRGDQGVRSEQVLDTSSYFLRSWEFVKSQLLLLSVSLFLLTCSSVTKLALPHFQGRIIDKVIPDKDGNHDHQGFVTYIKTYVVVMIIQGAVTAMYSAIFTLVSRRMKFSLRNALLENILSQDIAYFDGTESGRLLSCLTNDLDVMMTPIQTSLSSLLNNVLILIGGMVMCFIISYRLSMLAFVTINPITYLWNLYAQWSRGLFREMLAYWAEGNSIASQALSHVRTVKAFGCENRVVASYTEANQEALYRGVKDAWGGGLTSALTGYLDLGTGVLLLYFGGLLVFEGSMSVGELVTFQLFWNMMNNAYQNLQGLITSFTRSAAGAEKIFSLFDSKPDIDPSKGDDITWDVNGEIELRNVQFFYQMRPDNIVLEKFNLYIPAGKTTALVGPSGGGKSTIINLLLRFYDVKDGQVLLDGRDYKSLKVSQLRNLFGVVTQETELFSTTVEENIAYGLNKDEYTTEGLIEASKKAQAFDFISAMKDGFQTRIGERGNRLSGGQRQRLAIARIFLRKPKIILLDEATSALDENSQRGVQDALDILITESKATVIVVAHRLSTVKNADNIVVIEGGLALEQGTHNELIALNGVYTSMVTKQEERIANELEIESIFL